MNYFKKNNRFYSSRLLWFCLLFLAVFPAVAQTGYVTELRHSVQVPNTPEAESFMKYGDINVSLYTGTPSIGVPLHEYEGRELNLSMSLTYDASGIRVQQMATQAGLGWNLAIGGRISRIVNGAPDDYLSAAPSYSTFRDNVTTTETVSDRILEYINNVSVNQPVFSSVAKAQQYLTFLKDVNDGQIDTQLDFYSLNVLGINDMVVFDLADHQPRTLNNPRIKVEAFYVGNSLDSWKVTNEDGTEYYFEEKEMTRTEDNDWGGRADATATLYGVLKEYNSSWLLTRIVSANQKDQYDFNYTSFGIWTEEGPTDVAVSESNNVDDNNFTDDFYAVGTGSQVRFRRRYLLDQHFLTSVRHNGDLIIDISMKPREDHQWASALDEIKVYNAVDGATVKWARLLHTYFGNVNSTDYFEKRLKLDEVKFLDELGNDIGHNYSFQYNDPNGVPSRASLARDYLGYFNNQNTNNSKGVLYPRMEVGGDVYDGADREPDITYATKGILEKMTYPTKGYTLFNYESPGSLFETVTSVRNVVKAFSSLDGGAGGGPECDPSCMDDFSNNIPRIKHEVVHINSAGTYKVGIVNTYNQVDATPRRGIAYLISLSDNQQLSFYDAIYGSSDHRAFSTANTGGEIVHSVYLAAGYYQITLANNDPSGVSSIRIFEEEEVVETREVQRYAGIRIAKTRNYSGDGEFASATEYHYVKNLQTGQPSRKVVFQPTLTYFVDRITPDGEPTRFVTRVNSSSSGSQPHIAYEKVIVANTGFDSPALSSTFPLGYTEYDFTVGRSGLQSPGAPPNISSYFTLDNSIGKENLVKEVDQNGTLKREQTNEYTGIVFYTQQSLYTVHNEQIHFHYSMIFPDGNNFRITKVGAEQWCMAPPGQAQSFYQYCENNDEPIRPSICNEPGNTCFGVPETASLEFRLNAMTGEYFNTLSVRTRTFGTDSGTDEYVELVENDFSGPGFLPRTVIRRGSTGDRRQVFYYPQDFTGSVVDAMVADNQLSPVIEAVTEEYISPTVKSPLVTQLATYGEIGNGFYPLVVEIAERDNPLEERERYLYDDMGNIIQRYHSEGQLAPTAYIWGYESKRIIAEIQNATYEQVSNLLATTTSLSNLRDNIISDMEIRNRLGLLRDLLPNSLVTIYTHKLGRGVTSVTEPNGLVNYYHYDSFGRLEFVKDHDGNIINQNEYNYRSN